MIVFSFILQIIHDVIVLIQVNNRGLRLSQRENDDTK